MQRILASGKAKALRFMLIAGLLLTIMPMASVALGQNGEQTIAEIAAADGRFGTLLTAAGIAELDEALADPTYGPVTLFAPTDDAFAALESALGEEAWNALLADPEALRDVLLYHVLEGEFTSEDITALGLPASVETALGQDIDVTQTPDGLCINGVALVIEEDIMASNGVIHVINTVLVPEAQTLPTIAEIAAGDGRFDTLLAAAGIAGLDEPLADPAFGPVTLFAPTDEAFAALESVLGEEAWNALLADPETLSDILLYHVLEGVFTSEDILALDLPTSVETALGQDIDVELTTEGLVINGVALVVQADIMASNGVIHVIDAVLVPELAPEVVVDRAAGADRFSTSVELATRAYGDFEGVDTVVIASGEDRAAADPLAAAGLCGVLDAPLFLVRPNSIPPAVAEALENMPEDVEIIIVGGPVSVSNAVATQLSNITGVTGVDREAGPDRYDTAADIADRMEVELTDQGRPMPTTALLANGSDPATFFDAMALSAISAGNQFPVLLVRRDAVPVATSEALAEHGLTERIVAGGPNTVSAAVVSSLGAERWSGADRYATAAVVASEAVDRGWASYQAVGVAAVLPDALTGGATIGSLGGVLLLTRTASLPATTANAIATNSADIEELYVFGGPMSVAEAVLNQIELLLMN